MILDKSREWDVAGSPGDVFGLLHDMEAVLVDAASPELNANLKAYFLGAGGEAHHGVARDDLPDVAASLSKPLILVKAGLEARDSERNHFRFDVWVNVIKLNEARPFKVRIACYGPMNEHAAKLFDRIHARFAKEIGRRNRASPLPAPSKKNTDEPVRVSKSSIADSPTPSSSFMKTLTTHPLPVTVIGSIIAGGVIWLLGLLITTQQSEQAPSNPQPSTSQLSSTSAPTTSASTSNVSPPSR